MNRRMDDHDWSPEGIRWILDNLDLTQGQLANKIGVKRETINRWANGKTAIQTEHKLKLIKSLRRRLINAGYWEREDDDF